MIQLGKIRKNILSIVLKFFSKKQLFKFDAMELHMR